MRENERCRASQAPAHGSRVVSTDGSHDVRGRRTFEGWRRSFERFGAHCQTRIGRRFGRLACTRRGEARTARHRLRWPARTPTPFRSGRLAPSAGRLDWSICDEGLSRHLRTRRRRRLGCPQPYVEGVFALGRTREETEVRMAEALAAHLAYLRDQGRPTPEPHTDAGRVAA